MQGCANLWGTSMSFLPVTSDAARGLQCPQETCKRCNENRFTSFKPTRTHVDRTWTARDQFSAPFAVVKQYHVAGNTLVNIYLKIRNNDDRDFAPKMTFKFGTTKNLPLCTRKPPNLAGLSPTHAPLGVSKKLKCIPLAGRWRRTVCAGVLFSSFTHLFRETQSDSMRAPSPAMWRRTVCTKEFFFPFTHLIQRNAERFYACTLSRDVRRTVLARVIFF